MPVKLANSRTLLALLLALMIQPSAALSSVHKRHHAGSNIRAAEPRAPAHHDNTPGYDDPSRYGGGTALPVMSELSTGPTPDSSSATSQVRVQPRGGNFSPESDEAKAVQRRITDFNEARRFEDQSLDRKLIICRGC